METIVFDHAGSTFLVNQAHLVTSADQVDHAGLIDHADGWDIEQSNPFITWVAGDFVEGDKPNSNKQFWTAGDLELAEYTIKYAPLNMVHKFRNPVGFYAATRTVSLDRASAIDGASLEETDALDWDELQEVLGALEHDGLDYLVVLDGADQDDARTPSGANAPYEIVKAGRKWTVVNNAGEKKATFSTKKAAQAYQRALYTNVPGAARRAAKVKWTGKAKNRMPKTAKASLEEQTGSMKIQALSGIWSHLFPFETSQVERASEEGALFFSMECRGSHLVCAGEMGCGNKYEYADVQSHCDHLLSRTSVRHIVNPVFRGGALIVPPTRPGWRQANASVINEAVMQEAAAFAEQTTSQYKALQDNGLDLTASAWEHLMGLVVSTARSNG